MLLNHAVVLLHCVCSFLSAFVVGGDRTRLQKGDLGEGEREQVRSWEGKGMVLTTSLDRSLCSIQSTERARRDSDDPLYWISNQAEYLCHPGRF